MPSRSIYGETDNELNGMLDIKQRAREPDERLSEDENEGYTSIMFPTGGPESPRWSSAAGARKPSSRPVSMGGSRPPSPTGHKGRTLSMVSAATTAAGVDQYGYVDVVRSAKPVLHGPASLPGSTKAASGRARSVTGESARGGPTTDAGVREADEREHDHAISSHAFDGPAAGPPVKFAARSEYFTPQSAWYLMRTLVGMELQSESDQLYRLSSLHGEVRRVKRAGRHDVRSDDGSDSSDSDDDDIDDGEMDTVQFESNAPATVAPILRYLVKNFLLTLPLVRDVTAPEGVDLAGSDLEAHPYWTHGILPILRALEDADLAVPVDLGRRSLSSILVGIYGRHLVERFVSEGIKLAPAYQGEAGDGMRREDMGQNPLMTLDLPRQPAPMSRSGSEPMLDGIPRSDSGPIASGASTPQRPNRFSNLLRRSFLGTSPVVEHTAVVAPAMAEEPTTRPHPKRTHSLHSTEPATVAATPARSIKSEKTVLPAAVGGDADASPVLPSTVAPSPPNQRHQRNMSDASALTSSTDPNGTSTTAVTAEDGGNETDTDADPLGQRALFQPSNNGGRTSSPASAAMHTAPQTPAAPQTPTPRDSEGPVQRSSSGMLASWVGYIAGVNGRGSTDTPEADKTVRIDPVTPSKATVGQLAPPLLSEPTDASDLEADDAAASALGPHGGMLFPTVNGEEGAVVPAMAFSTDEERLNGVTGYDVPDEAPSSPESSHPSPRTPSFNSANVGASSARGQPKIQPPPRSTSHQRVALAPPVEDKATRKRREKEEKAAAKAAKAAATPSKKRFTFFGGSKTNNKESSSSSSAAAAASSSGGLGEMAKKNKSAASLKESISSPMLIHPDEPVPDVPRRDGIAAMALPDSFAPETGRPLANGQLPHQTNYVGPVAVPLVPKRGHAWPWGAPVPFWKGTPVHRVEWGGFEADVVGVRKTFAGRSYIIRVRRPQRLDEFVLRDEGQFKKYLNALDAMYPSAHVRRIPADSIKPAEDAIDPAAPPRAVDQTEAGRNDRSSKRLSEAVSDDEGGRPGSRFSRSFRAALADRSSTVPKEPYRPPTDKARRKHNLSRQSAMDLQATGSYQPAHLVSVKKSQEHLEATGLAPPYDAHRRALRGWLRDTLSIRTVGHNKETAAFLLLGPIQPKEADLRDMARRTAVDETRRKERIGVAQTAADRARTMHMLWTSTASECINGDGLLAISHALRTIHSVDLLPLRFQKSLEWTRLNVAQGLHDLLVAGEHSGPLFSKLRAINTAIPWTLIRNALKLPKSSLMLKTLENLLFNRVFGNKSLLQRLMAITLDDDPQMLQQQIEACRARIQSTVMCEKLTRYVYAPRETKALIRRHAAEHNLELVVCIVRGGDEPRLDRYDLERVVIYKKWMKRNPTQLAKVQTDNLSVRLIVDLQIYLRLLSRERDAAQIRGKLADDDTAEALNVVFAPVMEFIRRTYKVGNLAAAIGDLQRFIDQLIIIVDALRTRIQEPQKAVRILARLLARHTQPVYSFLHHVHREETLVEEFLQWIWTTTVFLRRGLARTLDIDGLLPSDPTERNDVLDEVDQLTAYAKKKRARSYQLMCRRFAGDIDGDDAIVVEGDGRGKSKIEPLVEAEPRPPQLTEIPRLLERFRTSIIPIFASVHGLAGVY